MTEANEVERRAIEQHREFLSREHGRDCSFNEACEDWETNYAVQWRERRQAEMLAREREEILRHKWIESEKAQRDLGSEAIIDWIHRYAAQWREWYQQEYEGIHA